MFNDKICNDCYRSSYKNRKMHRLELCWKNLKMMLQKRKNLLKFSWQEKFRGYRKTNLK